MDRRRFLTASAATAAGLSLPLLAQNTPPSETSMIGPKEGYSPQVGTLVSMLTWIRRKAVSKADGLSQAELDHAYDGHANTIGALLLHLAATEAYYGLHTFGNRKWGDWPDAERARWDVAMKLGPAARASIKGHDLAYYHSALEEVRERTLAELRKRDDAWLLGGREPFFKHEPTNRYCKWFHVVEHESHHGGQIAFLRSRLPGAKGGGE
jgi:uncharacterized damage-inducible protein DinB